MFAQVIWDDEPGQNVDHIQANGLTPAEVDEVLLDNSIPTGASRTSGLPRKAGMTSTGKWIVVVFEVIDEIPQVIYPVTAYEPDDPLDA